METEHCNNCGNPVAVTAGKCEQCGSVWASDFMIAKRMVSWIFAILFLIIAIIFFNTV